MTSEFNSGTRSLPVSTSSLNEEFDQVPAQTAEEISADAERFDSKDGGGEDGDEGEDEYDVVEDDGDEYDDEEEDLEERENEGEQVAATTAEQLIERRKLDDGFFEVESIRKRRICKGEPQYLIKWRGWPESANTWEPVDHLQTCPDVVEAYEKSLNSGQKKSSRKRKRKFTQQKKKMQFAYGATKSKIPPIKLSLSNEYQDSHPETRMINFVVKRDEGIKRSRTPKKVVTKIEENQTEPVHPSGQNGQTTIVKGSGVHLEGDGHANELSKLMCAETGQSNQRRGAQRRKSGSVRRFMQEETSLNVDWFGSPSQVNGNTSKRSEQIMVGSSDALHKKKSGNSRSSVITKIIRPISYSSSMTNNVQDIAVTFVGMRSDGKQVMVDNKFLKATNPLLLINFYEKHLRYNPV